MRSDAMATTVARQEEQGRIAQTAADDRVAGWPERRIDADLLESFDPRDFV
jgi:hypothetical protein